MRKFWPLLLLLALAITGCSLLPEQIDETKDWSAAKLYGEAKASLNGGDYEQAIHYYELLEARYPFGRYAQQAQLESAYAYYRYDEPSSAIAAADRFIKLHPKHPNVDYAYYLKGLANFNSGRGLLERYVPQDPTERDPGAARQSFYDFAELVKLRAEGRFTEGKLEGWGTWRWSTGYLYRGEFAGSEFNGEGVFTWPDGARYTGQFVATSRQR